MDLMLLRTFQRQVELQCQFLLTSANDINAGLQSQNVQQTFYGIQNLLNAAANVSKALYGSGGKKTVDRKPLRDSIGVDDNSSFREVAMRNNFEHLDERLDRWWSDSKSHNICDMNIASRQSISGIDSLGWFRNFDPQTTDVTFWSEDFNIQNIVNEAQRILPKLQEEADKPHWETGGR